jgi:hypothetical protein
VNATCHPLVSPGLVPVLAQDASHKYQSPINWQLAYLDNSVACKVVINVFARTVVAESYTLSRRIATQSCPLSWNTSRVFSEHNWNTGTKRTCKGSHFEKFFKLLPEFNTKIKIISAAQKGLRITKNWMSDRQSYDFWGWDANEAHLRCPDKVGGDIWIWSTGRGLKHKFY